MQLSLAANLVVVYIRVLLLLLSVVLFNSSHRETRAYSHIRQFSPSRRRRRRRKVICWIPDDLLDHIGGTTTTAGCQEWNKTRVYYTRNRNLAPRKPKTWCVCRVPTFVRFLFPFFKTVRCATHMNRETINYYSNFFFLWKSRAILRHFSFIFNIFNTILFVFGFLMKKNNRRGLKEISAAVSRCITRRVINPPRHMRTHNLQHTRSPHRHTHTVL